ncbi:MAG: glycerophosphodiester phosphodiesterase [Acidimicrobiales bacterium]|nr:glycerophosphodiester phosphodiesterase [Acidimicrobiales bacterium]
MATSPAGARAPIGFAHRGARDERRENTLDAFERALELGATGLESDAWLTADGVVVLDHDGVAGPFWRRRPLSVLPRASLPGHIPSLEELYGRCGSAFELSLDVKDPAALGAIIDTAQGAGAAGRLWLCGADWRQPTASTRSASGAHLVESTSLAKMREGLAGHAARLAQVGVSAINLHRNQWNRDRVGEVHSSGLAAFGWDAQSRADIDTLLDCGVDGLYSDHVDRMMTAIRRRRP